MTGTPTVFSNCVHLLVGLDHRMQRPVLGGVLHDQLRRLVVGDVIVAALAGTIADRQPLEQLFAVVERLAQAQQIAFAAQLDAELLAHRAGAAIAADEIGGAQALVSAIRCATRAVTPSPSCCSDRNSQPKRTVMAGMVSAMPLSSGSSVYCEIS